MFDKSYYLDASKFIAQYEGFTPIASWDVNAWRIGHGSDTITLDNGTYRKVVQGDKTTKINAGKDLARRIPEFENKVINYIAKYGVTNRQWEQLPKDTKVALLSFAYNYGNIVKRAIREAIKTGDVNEIADAVLSSTINDNKNTIYYNGLRKRRQAEADLIRNSKPNNNVVKLAIPFVLISALLYYLKDEINL